MRSGVPEEHGYSIFKIESVNPEDGVSWFLQEVVPIHARTRAHTYIQRHVAEDRNFDIHNRKNLKSHTAVRAVCPSSMCGEVVEATVSYSTSHPM
jgi:hypothetical protein